MAEQFPTDAELAAMQKTFRDPSIWLYEIGKSPHFADNFKALWRIAKALVALAGLEVYKDGDLTFGVRAGRFMDGATVRDYAGAAAQALTNNQTNYIYLTPAAVLTVNITGFPDAGTTPHIPLATISAAGGVYGFDDVTDYRGRAIFCPLDGIDPASRQDLMPNLNITAGAEAADKRTITIQARDAGSNDLAERVLVRVWIAAADYGAPDATGNTVAVETGTQIEAVTANAYYVIESDAGGTVAIGVTVAGAASRYIMAEIDGRVYSSGEVTWAA
ncbi:MAG TPA: hypothetical protein VMY35_08515 [Phycisphaerae bacterium]|nr:hypothetical protein [Phycisphaerae bacterium]